MGKVERYTREMISTYREKGYWTDALTVDFWEQNAQRFPDDEALIDSQFRLTWS